LTGVFEDPSVNAWLQQARLTVSGARVTVSCQATMLGEISAVGVRWQTGAKWGIERNVGVARVSQCSVRQ
jgi:hypothetical protein